ncbi:MAG: galactokinase [Actinobacteria bacterium]|nr:galactokinase [Actinomycetota bacterium]
MTGVSAGAAAAWFTESYGDPPAGVWFAPGRANLIGEHTDYNEGWVLPFALEQGVVVAAAGRGDGGLAARSRQAPGAVVSVAADALAPGAVTGWAAYPAGVAWALREAGCQGAGAASLAIDSDLPQGAGLSSSAALECATALALTALAGAELPRPRLAALARRAENAFVGVPSGIMDQSASLLCEAGHALLLDCRTGATTAVPFDPAAAGLAVLIVDTRAQHELAGGEYASRRAECEAAARSLAVRALRDAGADAVERLADPVLRRRARHVVTDNQRVHRAVSLLRAGAIGELGPLLTASHRSLRDDFGVSWPEADAAVAGAVAAGALGARMIGGGFGGSVLALVPQARSEDVRAGVSAAFGARGWAEPLFFDAVPSASARRLR